MILNSINRSIKFALQSFWRNIWLSLATIFIIFLTFLSINFIVIINSISESSIEAVKQKIDVSVYFKEGVKESKISEIKSRLETVDGVKEIIYYSPEQNLAEFKERHKNDITIQETLAELEGNPLGATLIIRANDLQFYPQILSAIDNPAYSDLIEEKSYDDHQIVIEKINSITDNVRRGALIISAIFVLIAALIIFNTVRIAIFTHHDEISIMKLVGASNGFIRSPFILENVFSGIIACILAIVAVYGILTSIQPYLAEFFGGTDFNVIGYFNGNFIFIFGWQLLGIIILSIFSSALAIGKYLDV